MYENVVYVTTSRIKEIARSILNGKWKPFVIGCLIYYLLVSSAQDILGVFFSTSQIITMGDFIYKIQVNTGGRIYYILLGGALELGFAMYCLNFFRNGRTENSLLFEGFSHFGKATLLNILILIFSALWGMLFIIPGIVAYYRYRMAYYIMLDHPEYSPLECIRESKRIMMGNKGKLFGLDLSFIGWLLLSLIPMILYMTVVSSYVLLKTIGANGAPIQMPFSPLAGTLISIGLSLPTVIVLAYRITSEVAFYQLATRRLIVVEQTPPQYGYGGMNGRNNGYYGNGGYGGYPQEQNNYPPEQNNYPPEQNNYPPEQNNYPPEQNNFPTRDNYPPRGNNGPKERRDIDEEPDNSRDLD